MLYHNIKQFSVASYRVDIGWDHFFRDWVNQTIGDLKVDLDPDFQRVHVWTKEKQIKFVEFCLKGGTSARNLYFNCVGWQRDFIGPFVLVDGKQRIEAVRSFLEGEIKAFGIYNWEYEDKFPSFSLGSSFSVHVNNLPTKVEVLEWYLDLNDGGVVHTEEELSKVRDLLVIEGKI